MCPYQLFMILRKEYAVLAPDSSLGVQELMFVNKNIEREYLNIF